MLDYSQQAASVFNFLNQLDCYLTTERAMITETERFCADPQRKIAALVGQNISLTAPSTAPFIRLLFVVSGALTLKIKTTPCTLPADCFVLCNAATPLTYQTPVQSEVLTFFFKPDYFDESLLQQLNDEPVFFHFFNENKQTDKTAPCYFVFDCQRFPDLPHLAFLLLKQVVKMKYANNRITRAAFILFFSELNDHYQACLQEESSAPSLDNRSAEILSYLQRNFRTLTLTQLAHHFYLNPNYLSTFIKEKTGRTFSTLIQHYRIEHAKQLLDTTELSIEAVSQSIGYHDQTFFFQLFKRKTGLTPLQYRKKR